jgi:hypothetical protein
MHSSGDLATMELGYIAMDFTCKDFTCFRKSKAQPDLTLSSSVFVSTAAVTLPECRIFLTRCRRSGNHQNKIGSAGNFHISTCLTICAMNFSIPMIADMGKQI